MAMSCITLTHAEWTPILAQIKTEHRPSVFLIRDAMKRELGFTVREHTWYDYKGYKTDIRLDFYTESAHTWFRLKYL
jgi:hypothetical protein